MGQKTTGQFRHSRFLSAVVAATLITVFGILTLATPAHAGTTKVIVDNKQGLDQRPSTCSGGLQPMAYFVINQVDSPADAPTSITVKFSDGSSTTYPLLVVNGKAAKYQGPVPAGAYVTSASAVIYEAWSGEFVLSHYLCGTPQSSTTSSSTSSSTDPSSTTSTTKKSGGSSSSTSPTTRAGGSHSSTPTDRLGASTGKPRAAASQSHFPLAFTGSNSTRIAAIGVASILAGLLLLTVKRRRVATTRVTPRDPRGPGAGRKPYW